MDTKQATPTTIDEYIAAYPTEVQSQLQQIRQTIGKAAPHAQEAIKYQMPTFTLNGNMISFAAYQNHIGLYPVPEGTPEFNEAIAPYRAAKSTLRFPLDQPLPLELITQIVKLRARDMLAKAATSRPKK